PGPAAPGAAGDRGLGPGRSRRMGADRSRHAAARTARARLRDRRRDEPPDLQERLDGALRGAGRGEPHRLARARDDPEGFVRRARHVLPRDGRGQGDVAPIRLCPPPGATEAEPLLARGQVALQPHLLGHGPAGPDPRALDEGKERTMSVTSIATLDMKGLSCPLPIVKTAKYMKTVASGEV